jgi:hypothetical protein
MSGLAVLLLLVMLARGQQGGGGAPFPRAPGTPAPRPITRPTAPDAPINKAAKQMPPPWPQAMPSGLPPFGPGGWEPDQPPPVQVQARAVQLLPQLWKFGAGTKKTEQTAGRWITYVASKMGKKQGVVAYRLRAPAPAPVEPTSAPILSV